MSARKSSTNRKLYPFPENLNRVAKNKFIGGVKKREDIIKLVKNIDENLIGKNATFTGPYGRRKVVYCDYATSGRSLQFIEDYIIREILPNCGNVCNPVNVTSLQSLLFRNEAKEIIKICVNATDDDIVVFSGLGCKTPVKQLLETLNLNNPVPPVVFLGPFENRSAILPWKEMGAKVIRISESKGLVDLNDLENQLIAHQDCAGQLIGCFSAANSITGILADDIATTLLLHQYGALAFWDYSIAAPYVQLDMNSTLPGVKESAVHRDAIFFSGHKFIGGAQTPGVLIAKKYLFKNLESDAIQPSIMREKMCSSNLDLLEDQSSATIVEDIRVGLVVHLKEVLGVPAIMSRAEKITRTVLAHVKNIPEFVLLGSHSLSLKRLPFFSFMVRHSRGMFLHHNFVCSVLNDVFGIQAHGSCADANFHSLNFMGIDSKLAKEYDQIFSSQLDKDTEGQEGLEILRPGFTKISFPFCISDAELGFVLEALKMVATEGWKLLPQYSLKSSTGEWKHNNYSMLRERKWLGFLKYIDGRLVVPERKISSQGTCPVDYEECLHVARCIFNRARKIAQRYPLTAQKFVFNAEIEPFRWFMLPSEAHNLLIGNSQCVRHKIPFDPNRYKGLKGDPEEINKSIREEKDEKDVKVKNEELISKPSVAREIFSAQKENIASNHLNVEFNKNSRSDKLTEQSPPHYVLTERQNSFSSEISNSDCPESSTYQTNWYSNTNPYMLSSHLPAANSYDVFGYSPQSSSTYLMNQPDVYCSNQLYNHQNKYVPQKNYPNWCNYDGLVDNALYVDPSCNNGSNLTNFGAGRTQYSPCKLDLQHPSNKVHFLLGRSDATTRQRCNSLGSSLVFHPRSRGNSAYSCRSLTDGETSLNLSECSLSSNEDIHAYVTEVTKELATEIKSEIREVISKVEDVLSESADNESSYNSSEHRGSKYFDLKYDKLERTNSLPSTSANDIAQYLMGVSKEMAEEMKSQIRGLVNAVVTSDSSLVLEKKEKKGVAETSSKDKKDMLKTSETSTINCESISQSQDSGINLSYSDATVDPKTKNKEFLSKSDTEKIKESKPCNKDKSEYQDVTQKNDKPQVFRSELFDSLQENETSFASDRFAKRKISKILKKVDKDFAGVPLMGEYSDDEEMNTEKMTVPKWYCPSKAVWKPTVEALKEYNMIQNGDKVLVCLSEGKTSFAILHTLQQYRFYALSKGISFELGAATFNLSDIYSNAKTFVPYLKSLGIPYYFDVCNDSESNETNGNSSCNTCRKVRQSKLCLMAKKNNCNVIALGQNFDDVVESFLLSAFHNGKLRSMKANYYLPGDNEIRIIRPFVYVREKALKQFVDTLNFPSATDCSTCKKVSKERLRSKELLSYQESLHPRLFNILKATLHPLISGGFLENDMRRDKNATKT